MREQMARSDALQARVWIAPILLTVSTFFGAQAPVPEPVTDQETELGQAAYEELGDKVEIIESSALYDRLKPVADAITRVAQPRYEHLLKFFWFMKRGPTRSRLPAVTCMSSIPCCTSLKIPNSWQELSATRYRIRFITMR